MSEAQRFRTKPVFIEAMQFSLDPNNGEEIERWSGDFAHAVGNRENPEREWRPIALAVGPKTAIPGDWIIRDEAGDFSLCKRAIFEATYEPV